MKTINATIERFVERHPDAPGLLPPIMSIVASPLLHHLASIQINHAGEFTPLTNASLALLAQYAPNLQSLSCNLTLTPNEPLILPPKLQSLQLQHHGWCSDAAANGMLTALAALPLSHLRLLLEDFERETAIDLSILAACRSLNHLELNTRHGGPLLLSDTQVDQIRSSLGHMRHFSLGPCVNSDELARFLKPPVTVHWQDIGFVIADARTGHLLLRLPTLTKLNLKYRENAAHANFLAQLPGLTALELAATAMTVLQGSSPPTLCWLRSYLVPALVS